jgi:hypothetical protein
MISSGEQINIMAREFPTYDWIHFRCDLRTVGLAMMPSETWVELSADAASSLRIGLVRHLLSRPVRRHSGVDSFACPPDSLRRHIRVAFIGLYFRLGDRASHLGFQTTIRVTGGAINRTIAFVLHGLALDLHPGESSGSHLTAPARAPSTNNGLPDVRLLPDDPVPYERPALISPDATGVEAVRGGRAQLAALHTSQQPDRELVHHAAFSALMPEATPSRSAIVRARFGQAILDRLAPSGSSRRCVRSPRFARREDVGFDGLDDPREDPDRGRGARQFAVLARARTGAPSAVAAEAVGPARRDCSELLSFRK